ncbi:hypothetical protein BV25DRAFT_1912849 [Artomyces pyxidatus]|uniref:Uncharacterized protein n=1 Tax=Artomyces pyxidatus TaxID=48021 RepID=A0ACB8TCP5_9AGAM|nr:hypothetical protein BV25DRAFT_1912849 [Artomyces pyxidatus]
MASTPSTSWPQHPSDQHTSRILKSARRYARRAFKGLMRSHHFKLPKYDLPLRFRPWFVLITALIMLALALLGLTNLAHALPMNDKLLHFFCLGIATGVFYFIFDVEEDARRIWIWRTSPLLITGFVCLLLGGIVSEFVQSLLPYKQFQFGDIVANLLGSAIGLYTAYHLERYHRHRREISRLYRPLSASLSSLNLDSDASDADDDGTGESSTQLLPMHHKPGTPASTFPAGQGKGKGKNRARPISNSTLADVWDEREELFEVGDDDSEDGESERRVEEQARPTQEGSGRGQKSVRWAEGSS